jgi:hypothetical protein
MIKKRQKWIALLVAVAFSWMLQVSAMPLTAADETEQVGSASVEQAPGFVEQQGVILSPDWNRPVKIKLKTVLIILGALFVLAIISIYSRGIGHEAAPREGDSHFGSEPGTDCNKVKGSLGMVLIFLNS